jgi:hypothetical protein
MFGERACNVEDLKIGFRVLGQTNYDSFKRWMPKLRTHVPSSDNAIVTKHSSQSKGCHHFELNSKDG